MAWTTPRTWTSSTLTAAQLNTDIRDNSNFLATDKAMWSISRAAVQSIPNATLTEVAWTSESFDNAGLHSLVTNTGRVTTTVAGKYLLMVTVNFAANATGFRDLVLNVSGSQALSMETAPSASAATGMQLNGLVSVTAGQYFTVSVYQNSGGALDLSSCWFSGMWVGF